MSPASLIATARLLHASATRETDTEQVQTHLKRAVSTAYYAVFHAVCSNASELVLGAASEPATADAWLQAYRGAEHTHVRNQCRNVRVMAPFPSEIREFAQIFVETQSQRNQADYNPLSDFSPPDVERIINRADLAISHLAAAPTAIRRAFAITMLLRNRTD